MMLHFWRRVQFTQFCLIHRRSLRVQRRWQEKYLHRLVGHACLNVPIWRSLARDKNIDPDSIRSIADIARLPTTSKHTFLGRMVEDYIDNSRMAQSYWYETSGTSGTPFTFLMGDHARTPMYSEFASLRFLWWLGVPFSKIFSTRLARIKIRAPSTEDRLFIPVEEFQRDARQALAQISQFKADIISTYPSILLDMARLIEREPSLLQPAPRFVLSFGEVLFPSLRKFVNDTMGSEIYDRYGLEEIGAIGVECRVHDGFHINTESVIIEITDDAYSPVAPGTEGRLVATDLFNYNMPFIRYDTGDHGRVSYEPCHCGLRSPRLWVKGRYTASLAFPSRRIHHLEFDGAMDSFMHLIFQYQIAKRSNTEIVARIIPGPAFHEDVIEKVREKLTELVGEGITVQVETVQKLPRTPRGKSRIVLDETDFPQGTKT